MEVATLTTLSKDEGRELSRALAFELKALISHFTEQAKLLTGNLAITKEFLLLSGIKLPTKAQANSLDFLGLSFRRSLVHRLRTPCFPAFANGIPTTKLPLKQVSLKKHSKSFP